MSTEPEAAKRYAADEEELAVLVDGWTEQVVRHREQTGMIIKSAGNPDIRDWLDATLYRHREQAYALGLLAERDSRKGFSKWWERNWFSVVLLGMIGGSMLLIGLVNGWS